MTPLEMARAFFMQTGRRGEFDESQAARMMEWLAEHGILITSDKGMIGGFVSPMFPTGELVAQELFWWGDAMLLNRFEKEARRRGATAIHMISLNDRVGRHYEARGYRKLETVYLKEF